MTTKLFHFRPERPVEDLVLSEWHRVPGKLARLLTNFQLDGIRFLYRNFASNQACLLNDESGLGKTTQVGAFLSAILPVNNSKRCLIIVRNEERAVNWHFHLSVLTRLHVKRVSEENDIDSTSDIFLVAWDVIRKAPSIAKTVFNCVILDDRDDFTASKPCMNFFLRHFENRISLIVASSDVTLDIKQLHSLLRLCGRLEEKYKKLKVFEDKFSLPKPEGKLAEDRAVLEAYFQRREKIINYCRDFRLRRYRHQFEDVLPLVDPSAYQASLKEWQSTIVLSKSASSLSSGSIKVLSSSSEKSTEELFQTYFDMKNEKLLNDEVSNINKNAANSGVEKQIPPDTEEMSPLLFESDTEETPIPAPVQLIVEESSEIIRPRALRSRTSVVESTANTQTRRSKRGKSKTPEPTTTQQQKRKSRRKTPTQPAPQLQLRSSDRRTRKSSPSATSRNAIIDVFRMIEKAEPWQNKRLRKPRKATAVKKEEPADDETCLRVSSDSESEIEETYIRPNNHQPEPDTTKTPDPIVVVHQTTPETNNTFNIHLLGKTSLPDSSEIQIYSQPDDQIVVLTSSSECSEAAAFPFPRLSDRQIPRRVTNSGKISPSPDIFDNYDEYEYFCSQRGGEGGGGVVRNPSRKIAERRRLTPSCLDRLEDDFGDKPYVIFTDMVQIPAKNFEKRKWNVYPNGNKITKYLSSQSLESSQPIRPDSTSRELEKGLKTPKRRKSLLIQRATPVGKKSPKSMQTLTTPGTTPKTGLTKWLIKRTTPSNSSHADETNKNSKRKRLDLFFAD